MTEEEQGINTHDDQSIEEREIINKLDRANELHDLKTVLSTEEGRRLIMKIIDFCGVYNDFYGDQNQINIALGMRRVGLFIQKECIEADKDAFKEILFPKNDKNI